MAAESTIRITQRKSVSGTSPRQRATLRSLGLRGVGRTVDRTDGPELQGMIRAVRHLIEVSDTATRSGKRAEEGGDG